MPSLPSLDTPLTDGTVTLRLSAQRDIPEVLIAYQDDPSLHVSLGEPRPPSGAALGRRAELALQERLGGGSLVLTILEGEGDMCRGEVRLREVDWPGGRVELSVWVAPGSRGRGLASRARGLAGEWLAATCGLDAVCRGAP
jgi:RimJ/RimL family protein N-acetyltransferase